MIRVPRLTVLLAAAALGPAGCGDDDGGGPAAPSPAPSPPAADGGRAQTLRLEADPSGALKFDRSTLSAKAGRVTVILTNPSNVPHAIEVEGQGIEEEGATVGKGGTSEVTVTLKPGEYEYYCPVGNHKEAGMEGKLTVE